MNEQIQQLIDEYIEKYCSKHKVTKEEAKKHAIVKIYEYFKENYKC